jgi:hypothetical protein
MYSAANIVPDFTFRRSIELADLKRIVEPAVIFEGVHTDTDGVDAYIYTVAGWLDGKNIATMEGGCTVGGDTMVIHADDRETADYLAGLGLLETIDASNAADEQYIEGQAALARLAAVGPMRRIELATAPAADTSDEFVRDTASIQALIGDGMKTDSGPPPQ